MDYDLTVIGAGWAGFNAAIKAKELGQKVCLIEKKQIGGTCLNSGCIPTKTLIQSAKILSTIKKSSNFGIETTDPAVEFPIIQERKNKIISQLRASMQFMLRGVDFINAEAQILSQNEIQAGEQRIKSKFILLATGSHPVELPELEFDSKKVFSSNEILDLDKIPGSLLIIGGGVIGCEFASLFNALGTQVTIVERLPRLIPGLDQETARKLETIFKKKGIKVHTGVDAGSFVANEYSLVLVCVGRTPNTSGLEKAGIKRERGAIVVDEFLKTNINNIYAAGDCTGKICLAHFAAYQGVIAAGNISNQGLQKRADNRVVPNCIFTDPEVATVGACDGEVMKIDFLSSGMARIMDETEGFIKVYSDKDTEEVKGAAIIGPRATELIALFSLAASNKLKVSEIRNTIFAHPTLSESIHDAVK